MDLGHIWTLTPGEGVSCAKCNTRIGWPGAKRPCKVYLITKEAKRALKNNKMFMLTPEQVLHETQRALDTGDQEGGYAIHAIGSHGRDGRRRTGM